MTQSTFHVAAKLLLGRPIRPRWFEPLLGRHPHLAWMSTNLVVVALYFSLGVAVSEFFARYGLFPAPIWLPASIALAAAMLGGARVMPGIFIGSFVTNLVLFEPTIHVVALISLTNAIGPVVGAVLVARAAPDGEPFRRLSGLFAFLAGGVLLHGAIVATGGAFAIWLGDPAIPREALESIWMRWWLSDSGGALYFAPALLLWLSSRQAAPSGRASFMEGAIVSGATLIVTLLLFSSAARRLYLESEVPYLLALPLAWLTLRMSLRAAYTLFTLVTIVATAGTVSGVGPFVTAGLERPLTALGAMLVLFSVNILLIAALVSEQRGAQAESKAKSNFLANMSHELRTPLNALLGFSDVIRHQLLGAIGHPKYREYAEHIHQSGQHLRSLIDDLLDLARIESGRLNLKPVDLDLPTALQETVEVMAGMAEQRGVSLAVADEGTDDASVHADPRALRQILLNLMSNAIKFTPRGGTVTLTATLDGRRALVSVSDTGVGMSEKEIAIALEPFGRSDNPYIQRQEGTGLGLPIVKALVENQGGTLSIQSERDVGTVVTIDLPLAPSTRESA